jgi:hypothetical protein
MRRTYNGRMNSLLRCLLLAALCAAAPSWAADDAPTPRTPPEPNVKRTVIEDNGARIEELRVRGQTVRIVVQPKKADGSKAPTYEIVPSDPGRDPSTPARSGLAGQRLWPVMSF